MSDGNSQQRPSCIRPRALQDWQIHYVKRAAKVRRKLSNKVLAAQFGVSEDTVRYYTHVKDKP